MTLLVSRLLADRLGLDARRIDPATPFEVYGLDSAGAVGLAGQLGEELGRELADTVAYDYPTVAALAAHVAGEDARPAAEEPAQSARAGAGSREPIAVVGLGCRYPGASGVEELWRLLVEGIEAVGPMPPDRWEDSGNERGGWLADVARFDPAFFGIAPREAQFMDPQQRLLLEIVWEALDDAGIPRRSLAGTATAAIMGVSTSDYAQLQLADPRRVDAYMTTGSSPCMAANRVSYLLDLHGPSMTVDTACSSSLVAVHLACQSIWSGESELALAGGVNLMLSPQPTLALRALGALSPDGTCRPFGSGANGYVRGEGAGVAVLKPLRRAVADGDRVYGAILGTAVGSDGRSNGLTAPNGLAQERVVHAAQRSAGVAPAEVGCVEAHGTGTPLGDPIEARALGRVLAERRPVTSRCSLSSIKGNLGHLESAAGIAGLTKLVLSLDRGVLAPSINAPEPNPAIPFDRLPLTLQRVPVPWAHSPGARYGGVSSFGYGGTNAHAVLCDRVAAAARLELAA